jgi:hypothetical protein
MSSWATSANGCGQPSGTGRHASAATVMNSPCDTSRRWCPSSTSNSGDSDQSPAHRGSAAAGSRPARPRWARPSSGGGPAGPRSRPSTAAARQRRRHMQLRASLPPIGGSWRRSGPPLTARRLKLSTLAAPGRSGRPRRARAGARPGAGRTPRRGATRPAGASRWWPSRSSAPWPAGGSRSRGTGHEHQRGNAVAVWDVAWDTPRGRVVGRQQRLDALPERIKGVRRRGCPRRPPAR